MPRKYRGESLIRNCPKYKNNKNCKIIIEYKNFNCKIIADNNNSLCKSCNAKKQHEDGKGHSWKGKNNPMFGSNRIGNLNPFFNKSHTIETKQHLSILNSGENHINFGKTWEEIYGYETAQKMRKQASENNSLKQYSIANFTGKTLEEIHGKERADEIKLQNSIRMTNNPPMKNRDSVLKMVKTRKENGSYVTTPETILKIRLKFIERVEQQNGQFYPFYNSNAISIIEKYGLDNEYNFKHAENGGEFRVNKLGYWLDGYDKEKNVAIEFYEKHHYDSYGNLKERELLRETEIINQLKCKFIRIHAFDVYNLKYEII